MLHFDLEKVRFDENGLVPVIVQDHRSKEVLTLAFMNKEAIQKTISTGETWFWSRSRQSLWHKGETSGNTQQVLSLTLDCDGDALLARVIPKGPACHTGKQSCFTSGEDHSSDHVNTDRFDILNKLENRIALRDQDRPQGAYTTYLFEQGLDKILKKVGEEASEVIIAAKNKSAQELRSETADLIYHLMVLLRASSLSLDEVLAELEKRFEK
mgnify:FL=1